MKTKTYIIAACGLLAVLSVIAKTTPSTAASDDPRIEHGRYLVHQTGLCIDCHSPRDAKGQFIESKHLMGAPIGFTPTVPMPWMPVAPRLAGLPAGYTSENLTRFLMTGERPSGLPTLPPMPPYRFNREDAEAVTAYLQSLPVESR